MNTIDAKLITANDDKAFEKAVNDFMDWIDEKGFIFIEMKFPTSYDKKWSALAFYRGNSVL